MKILIKKVSLIGLTALWSITLNTAGAAEFETQFRAGVGVSDNIARTAQTEVDETIMTIGFDFGVTEHTSKFDLDVRSRFDYVDYLDNTFDSEVIGGLEGYASVALIEERLRWIFQDNYGQQLFDPLQPARPDNRENLNFFTTGPTVNLLAGTRNLLTLDARYSTVNYEEQPSDNERLSGAVSIGRETSRDSRISLNVTGERIEFENATLAPSIERYAAFVRYERSGLKDQLSLDLGYNQAEAGGDKGDGVLVDVNWIRTTSRNGSLRMSGGSRYSDQGNIFRLLQDITLDISDTNDLPETTQPFLNYYYVVTYLLEQDRFSIDISASWNQEDYKGQEGLDRDIFLGDLRLQREVSRTIFAGTNVGFRRRDFKYINRRDDDLLLGLFAGYRFTPGFSLSFEYQHFQRNSVDVGADFTENRMFLLATYIPVWSRQRN